MDTTVAIITMAIVSVRVIFQFTRVFFGSVTNQKNTCDYSNFNKRNYNIVVKWQNEICCYRNYSRKKKLLYPKSTHRKCLTYEFSCPIW